MYNSSVGSIVIYGPETWVLNIRETERLLALEMNFWSRRLDHIRWLQM